MRACALLVISTGMLSVSAQTNCTTPLGVRCMVVESVNEQWSILQRGLEYHHSRSYQRSALASDGSVSYEYRFEKIPLVGASEVFAPTIDMYLGPSDRVVRIMHADRKFSRREPIIWHDRPYRRAKANDATCATGILHSGTDFEVKGQHTILGMNTYRWYRALDYGGYEEQFLAPALDCLPLRSVRVRKNMFRIPVLTDRREVKSIHFGEPDRALFQIPAGYTEVPDPSAEPLRRFVDANRHSAAVPAK